MHEHPLCDQRAGVEATYRLETKKAFVVDVRDEEADLVHMGGDHHPGAVSPLGSNHASQGVDAQVIEQRPQLVDDNRPHSILATRNTRCLAELLQQFQILEIRHIASK